MAHRGKEANIALDAVRWRGLAGTDTIGSAGVGLGHGGKGEGDSAMAWTAKAAGRCGLVLGALASAMGQAQGPGKEQGQAPAKAVKAEDGAGSLTARQAKAAAARRAYEQARAFYVERQPGSWLDGTYLWSVRLLHAQLELDGEAAEARTATYRTHLEGMASIERLLRRTARFGMTNQFDLSAVEYYRIEAEQWLEREQAK
jgi:hypothetical protein